MEELKHRGDTAEEGIHETCVLISRLQQRTPHSLSLYLQTPGPWLRITPAVSTANYTPTRCVVALLAPALMSLQPPLCCLSLWTFFRLILYKSYSVNWDLGAM